MPIKWTIPERLKAAFVMYTAVNLSGGRKAVRLFLRGRKGDPAPTAAASMVIRAPYGTTVVLQTEPGPGWERGTWRAIRLLKGFSVPGKETPLPGVRLPDLDMLDAFDAKKGGTSYQESYPLVDRFAQGEGWTFGAARDEELKNNVRGIMVIAPGLEIPR